MQTATVLYRTHATTKVYPSLEPAALSAAGLDPEWTELADGGPHTVNDALLRLAARGAGRVEAVPLGLAEDGSLRFASQRVRLLG